jgi:hypothetical protein
MKLPLETETKILLMAKKIHQLMTNKMILIKNQVKQKQPKMLLMLPSVLQEMHKMLLMRLKKQQKN